MRSKTRIKKILFDDTNDSFPFETMKQLTIKIKWIKKTNLPTAYVWTCIFITLITHDL